MPASSEVAFVIPAFEEQGAIGDVVRRARATGRAAEVLVVDDGSRDGTAEAARAAGARVLRLARNQGKGRALRAGVEAVPGASVVVFLDGDGQDAPEEVDALLDEVDAGADLVIGSRFLGELRAGAITPINRAGNVALTALMSLLYGRRITDSQAGFRAVRREAFLALPLRAARYEVETDMLARALRAGLRVVEVPVSRSARAAGRTKLAPVTTGLGVVGTMLRCRFL